MDCDQDTMVAGYRNLASKFNSMGLLAQKVYRDCDSSCLLTYLDFSIRNNCEHWLLDAEHHALLQSAGAAICFRGFLSNMTWEVGVARHRDYDQGIQARYLGVYTIREWPSFMLAFQKSVVRLRSHELFSEEIYFCKDQSTAIVIYEFKSKEARMWFLQDPVRESDKATMGIVATIRETNMDEKTKLTMGSTEGELLVYAAAQPGGEVNADVQVNVLVRNIDSGAVEVGMVHARADGGFLVRYTRGKATYCVHIFVNGHPVHSSPFEFRVSQVDPSKSRAEGPGLMGKCVNGSGGFMLIPRDCYGRPVTTEPLSSVLLATSNGPIHVRVVWDAGQSVFHCSFPGPLPEGEYFMDAEIDHMDVSNCPVVFTVGKGAAWQSRHSVVGGCYSSFTLPRHRHKLCACSLQPHQH
jgi:hypothetical protein